MTRFQHILFPVDSSERCGAVLPFVTALTRRFHSRLTLLNVIQIPTAWYGGFDAGFPVMIDLPELEEAARNELHALSADNMVDKVVVVGDPAFEIVQFAAKNDVDLIAMPTHGYGKFRSLLLGSVTAKVLHDAKCPVWTAPHIEDPELGKHLIPKSIMAAIDLASITVPLLQEFAALAREFAKVQTPWGDVQIKIARWPSGNIANASPEYEDCRAIAAQHALPLKQVMQEAMRIYAANEIKKEL